MLVKDKSAPVPSHAHAHTHTHTCMHTHIPGAGAHQYLRNARFIWILGYRKELCAEKCGERLGYTLWGAADGEQSRLKEEGGEGVANANSSLLNPWAAHTGRCRGGNLGMPEAAGGPTALSSLSPYPRLIPVSLIPRGEGERGSFGHWRVTGPWRPRMAS